MATKIQERKLKSIKTKSQKFAEKMENDIIKLCRISKYQDSSVFSYNIDRIRLFLKELNEFEFSNK